MAENSFFPCSLGNVLGEISFDELLLSCCLSLCRCGQEIHLNAAFEFHSDRIEVFEFTQRRWGDPMIRFHAYNKRDEQTRLAAENSTASGKVFESDVHHDRLLDAAAHRA